MKKNLLSMLALAAGTPALASQIILAPGESFPLSPVDVVTCAAPIVPVAPVVVFEEYDYCACVPAYQMPGFVVRRYKKVMEGFGSTLTIDELTQPFATERECKDGMSSLSECEVTH